MSNRFFKSIFFFARILSLFMFSVCFMSCATKAKFDGTANLTGLIVDEFNQPIYGFPVAVSAGMVSYETVMTNESGIFAIQNVKSGNLSFTGKKEGYSILDLHEPFYQRDKIICFQVPSVDLVFDRINERILQDDYEGGLNELKTVYAKVGSPVYGVVREYERCCKLGRKMERLKKSQKNAGGNKSVKNKSNNLKGESNEKI